MRATSRRRVTEPSGSARSTMAPNSSGVPKRDDGAATATLHADIDLMVAAMINLLDNAIKFTPPGGEVAVEVPPRSPAGVAAGAGAS